MVRLPGSRERATGLAGSFLGLLQMGRRPPQDRRPVGVDLFTGCRIRCVLGTHRPSSPSPSCHRDTCIVHIPSSMIARRVSVNYCQLCFGERAPALTDCWDDIKIIWTTIGRRICVPAAPITTCISAPRGDGTTCMTPLTRGVEQKTYIRATCSVGGGCSRRDAVPRDQVVM